ncbi:MAG TPA: ribonuclease R [Casimicrobiaceae bacterium]|nr:ribonuclease R [Casimicrobiaceae bacterium]
MSKKQPSGTASRARTAAAETAPASRRRVRREQGDVAIPERTEILQALREHGVPMPPAQLERRLAVDGDAERKAFAGRLAAMERDGQLLTNRKGALCVVAKLDLVTGTVQGHADGFGFLVPDDGGQDLFLSPKEMHKALHGDRATARQVGLDRRGRPEGAIVDVLERANREVVGRVFAERGIWYLVAENKRISQDILIPPDMRGRASPGQVVVAEVIEQPSAHREAMARVAEVLGNYTDPGMEIEIALRKHDLPYRFSGPAQRQAGRLPPQVQKADREGRADLTALPLVTIDGETARDFDDAVFCERKGKGFRLLVSIADVSHYVRDSDALDGDARDRGTSVYFPRRVIPMLPEELSNELCSLKPAVDRLCMACEVMVGAAGRIESYRFFPAVMHSRARLTYDQVWQWLSTPAGANSGKARALLPHLENLYALYKVLAAARRRRGAIDFETTELELRFDAHGKIETIVPLARNDAHKIIEECMLATNVCAAEFLLAHKHPSLYRVHEGPTPEKLAALKEFLAGSGLSLGGGAHPAPADYAALLTRIRDRPDLSLLQTVLLRSLQQAVYSPDNEGHFGLGYDAYTHFTSPIRRYPDLLVHRCIKACLARRRYRPGGAGWSELGVHCSQTERRADDATRDVESWLKCYFMQDRVGETFTGTVSGVAHFGLFVTLDGLNVDGLVHVTELGNDYFHYDAIRHALSGERSGKVYRLADRITVKVARVDLESTRIDFTLAVEPATATPSMRRKKHARAGKP